MELWVFRWTFSSCPSFPHLQLLDAKTTFVDSVGGGGGVGGFTVGPALNMRSCLNHDGNKGRGRGGSSVTLVLDQS